jgi:hypothetical protein
MRIDDQSEADPFGAQRAVFLQSCGESSDISSDLLLSEAIELAHDRRHLTVVHGDPNEVNGSRQLSGFYEELRRWRPVARGFVFAATPGT